MAFVRQSHALRQVRQGPTDQYWRNRMEKMIELETTAPPSERRQFSGSTTASAARERYPRCTVESRIAERSAGHGWSSPDSWRPLGFDSPVPI